LQERFAGGAVQSVAALQSPGKEQYEVSGGQSHWGVKWDFMGNEWDMNETNGGSMGFNGILWDFMVFNRGV